MTEAMAVTSNQVELDDHLRLNNSQDVGLHGGREPMRVSRSAFATPEQYRAQASWGGSSLGGFLSRRSPRS